MRHPISRATRELRSGDTFLRLVLLGVLTGLVTGFGGCAGYQIGARTLFRPDLRTVYVPVFQSESYRQYLGERLTEAVAKEIESRTPYKVVHTPDADSVLTGQLVSERKRVIAEDINDVPRDIEAELVVQVSWYDRGGGLIMQTTELPVAPLAVAVAETANFVPEAGQSLATAQQEAVERLARQIVAQMESAW